MFAFEIPAFEYQMQSRLRHLAVAPVEDDYSEESFPDQDRDGDLAWRCQEMIAAGQLLGEVRRWAKRPNRESKCAAA